LAIHHFGAGAVALPGILGLPLFLICYCLRLVTELVPALGAGNRDLLVEAWHPEWLVALGAPQGLAFHDFGHHGLF
jgi:hypothetical protein